MSKREDRTIEVKLFVDNEKKRVLFAESDKEFVDVLFSFLTMPLGTIVRLLGKQSRVGCLDQIYKSVEDLSPDYFQTKACKSMLLAPLNVAYSYCSRLKINIDDSKPLAVYVCMNTSCSAHADYTFSSFPDVVCKCGRVMEYAGERPANDCSPASFPTPVFVKGDAKFIITDDLMVALSSTSLMLSLFERFGVRGPVNLQQTSVHLTSEKITSLLQRSLTSKEPLSGLYFDNLICYDEVDLSALSDKLYADQGNGDVLSNVKIRVLHTKNSSLVYAEVSGGFVDLLFGLLSIPIGSVMKTYGQCSGCLYNLYKSLDADVKECVRSECQSLLLSPKSSPFSSCVASRVLQVDESAPKELSINSCFSCLKNYGFYGLSKCSVLDRNGHAYCINRPKSAMLREINPKSPNRENGSGEAYVKDVPTNFMMTADMRVIPLSLSNATQVISEAKIPTGELLEKEIPVTKRLLMEIQRAALNRTSLSSVLLPSNHKGRKANHLRTRIF